MSQMRQELTTFWLGVMLLCHLGKLVVMQLSLYIKYTYCFIKNTFKFY